MNRDRDLGKVTMSEMLAAYTDNILKKGGVKLPEE